MNMAHTLVPWILPHSALLVRFDETCDFSLLRAGLETRKRCPSDLSPPHPHADLQGKTYFPIPKGISGKKPLKKHNYSDII